MKKWLVVGGLTLIALGLRFAVRDFTTGDLEVWVISWFNYLNTHGFAALGGDIPNGGGLSQVDGNYTPPYFYLLYIGTWVPVLKSLYLIKAISVAFDFVAAGLTYKLVKHVTGASDRAWIGFVAVLLAPTLIANGALWGQCDAIHTSLMVGAVYFSITQRPLAAVLALGVAISFKAQPVFLAPYMLMLFVAGRLPFRYLLLVPVTYVVMMVPALLVGRPLVDLLLVYVRQGEFFDELSMNAPNLYFFMSNDYYEVITRAGVLVTVAISLLYAFAPARHRRVMDKETLLLAAVTSVAMAPFFLPKMHDRYFMPADILAIALACCRPKLWFIAVGFQVTSSLAYVPIITDSMTEYGEYVGLMPVAVILNSVLVATLLAMYARTMLAPSRAQPMSLASPV